MEEQWLLPTYIHKCINRNSIACVMSTTILALYIISITMSQAKCISSRLLGNAVLFACKSPYLLPSFLKERPLQREYDGISFLLSWISIYLGFENGIRSPLPKLTKLLSENKSFLKNYMSIYWAQFRYAVSSHITHAVAKLLTTFGVPLGKQKVASAFDMRNHQSAKLNSRQE